MAAGHKDDDFVKMSVNLLFQRFDIGETQMFGQPSVQPVCGPIQVGVDAGNSDLLADGPEQNTTGRITGTEAPQRLKNKWMVGDNQLRLLLFCLFESGFFGIESDQDPFNLGCRITNLEADIVPVLGQRRGAELIENAEQIA